MFDARITDYLYRGATHGGAVQHGGRWRVHYHRRRRAAAAARIIVLPALRLQLLPREITVKDSIALPPPPRSPSLSKKY